MLGDETSDRTAEVTIRLDLSGSRDNPETRTDPPGSTPTPAIAMSLDGELATGAGEPPLAVSGRLELAGG